MVRKTRVSRSCTYNTTRLTLTKSEKVEIDEKGRISRKMKGKASGREYLGLNKQNSCKTITNRSFRVQYPTIPSNFLRTLDKQNVIVEQITVQIFAQKQTIKSRYRLFFFL